MAPVGDPPPARRGSGCVGQWESRDLLPEHHAPPTDDGPRSCCCCSLLPDVACYCISPDHHLSISGRRVVRLPAPGVLRSVPDAPGREVRAPNAKRPTWHSAQVGRVVPLPDPGWRCTLRSAPSTVGSCTDRDSRLRVVQHARVPALQLSSQRRGAAMLSHVAALDERAPIHADWCQPGRAHVAPTRAGWRAPARAAPAGAGLPRTGESEGEGREGRHEIRSAPALVSCGSVVRWCRGS